MLTLELIAKEAQRQQRQRRRRAGQPAEEYVGRLTHLNLSRKQLTDVNCLHLCPRLLMLSVYDNMLTSMASLNVCANLTQLHLQNNNISRIEGIGRLRHLKSLFLANNEIVVIEGLHQLHHLRELHVQNQRLPPGERLILDPRSMHALRNSLTHLNLSGCHLESLQDLSPLTALQHLDVSGNDIVELSELTALIQRQPHLEVLQASRNPFCLMQKYREEIVSYTPKLAVLNGEAVHPQMHGFLVEWKNSKQKRREGHPLKAPAAAVNDRYARPQFRRQGVTLEPRFVSRLRPATKVLPPIGDSTLDTGTMSLPATVTVAGDR